MAASPFEGILKISFKVQCKIIGGKMSYPPSTSSGITLPGKWFWLRWMLVNLASILLCLIITVKIFLVAQLPATVGLLLSSWGIALGQWWVLRPHIRHAYGWLAVTTASLIVGIYIGLVAGWNALNLTFEFAEAYGGLVAKGLGGLVGGSVMGSMMGFAQWLVLRTQISASWRWLLASTLGWGTGIMVTALLFHLWWVLPLAENLRQPLEIAGIVSGLAIASSITGIALVWLLLHSSRTETGASR
jgi:hypothetical protein